MPTANNDCQTGPGRYVRLLDCVYLIAIGFNGDPQPPVIGIGGVTPQRAATVIASGAHGVAAIRGIWDTPSPREAVQVYLDAVERAIQEKRNE